MKKYTIIYSVFSQYGSHTNSITRYNRVETDNLTKLLEDDKYSANVWFVFEGWPKLEGEEVV